MTEEKKKLYRSRTERMIAGVCGGLAEYLNVDPVLIRLAFVLVTLSNGAGLLLYLILALIMPEEPAPDSAPQV
ncbi:MAG TPA: PspC domain-containing protein [Chloroflexi bacterium]|nr:PspC domain-containing protein [Chloroflexota bacterium]